MLNVAIFTLTPEERFAIALTMVRLVWGALAAVAATRFLRA